MDSTQLIAAPSVNSGTDLTRQIVIRNDLVDRVLQHSASLVLFIAPAGFGKTIAMSQLRDVLQSQGSRTAWWSLDRSDNDPQRLFEFLRQVLHPPVNANELDPVCIFLDDFEVVEGGPLPEIVKNLLGQLPAGSRLVIGSRRKPGIGLAQLRA